MGQTLVSKSEGPPEDAAAQFSTHKMSNLKFTYLFLLDQLENFHEVANHEVHLDTPLHKLGQLIQGWLTVFKVLSNLFIIKHHVHLIHKYLKSVHGLVRVLC